MKKIIILFLTICGLVFTSKSSPRRDTEDYLSEKIVKVISPSNPHQNFSPGVYEELTDIMKESPEIPIPSEEIGDNLSSIGTTEDSVHNLNPISAAAEIWPYNSKDYVIEHTRNYDKQYENSSITYFDGKGRPIQSIKIGYTPEGSNLVNITEYDVMGRPDSVTHLPFVSPSMGYFISNGATSQKSWYSSNFPGDDGRYPYSIREYRDAITDKIKTESGFGYIKRLAGNPRKHKYGITGYTSNYDNVKKFSIDDQTGKLKLERTYTVLEILNQDNDHLLADNRFVSKIAPLTISGQLEHDLSKRIPFTIEPTDPTNPNIIPLPNTRPNPNDVRVSSLAQFREPTLPYFVPKSLEIATDELIIIRDIIPSINNWYQIVNRDSLPSILWEDLPLFTGVTQMLTDDNLRLGVTETWLHNAPNGQKARLLEFNDHDGNVIAKRVMVDDVIKRTDYYVYDSSGNLRYVIPDICASRLTQLTEYDYFNNINLKNYCYYYEYNDDGQVVKQYSPGAAPVYNIYDNRGRLAMTQDGNMRLDDKWKYIKYDSFDRPVVEGIHTGGNYQQHVTAMKNNTHFYEERLMATMFLGGSGIHYDYSNRTYPVISQMEDVLNVYYYDSYDFTTYRDYSLESADQNYHITYNPDVIGLPTATVTKVLNENCESVPSGALGYLSTVTYYDKKYNPILTVSDLYPNGVEYTANTHSFSNQVIKTSVSQRFGFDLINKYEKTMTYDNQDRLTQIHMQPSVEYKQSEKVLLAEYIYNELGMLVSKKTHNGRNIENYYHGVGGQIQHQSSKDFTYDLFRQENDLIGQVNWGHGGRTTDAYIYTYDDFGRLTSASHDNDNQWSYENRYDLMGVTYDANDNIRELVRSGGSPEPFGIVYEYSESDNGNAISKVSVGGGSGPITESMPYRYDSNGNMTFDGLRNMEIEYNILGLPKSFNSNGLRSDVIYTATGEKISAGSAAGQSSFVYYCGGVMTYNGNSSGPRYLEHILHQEGHIALLGTGGSQGGQYAYNYFTKDHLGSVRSVRQHFGPSSMVVQSTDYYPFGLAWNYENLHHNRYLFSGKEYAGSNFWGDNGLPELYDFHARFYDPYLGRWFNQDPALQDMNPYTYCTNNPVLFIDPDGKMWIYQGSTGFLFFDRDVTSVEAFENYYGGGDYQLLPSGATKFMVDNGAIVDKITVFDDKMGAGTGYAVSEIKGVLDNSKIEYGSNYTIFGTTDGSVFAPTLYQNYFNSCYIGPNNPKDYIGEWSYQYDNPARLSLTDMAAMRHDQGYDEVGAAGIHGALFNADATAADWRLVKDSAKIAVSPNATLGERGQAVAMGGLFTAIGVAKTINPHNVAKKMTRTITK